MARIFIKREMDSNDIPIEGIENEYGGLWVGIDASGMHCWAIETGSSDDWKWQEIPKSLYDELIKFNKDNI